MNGVKILYGDVAPNAKENFKPSSDEKLFDTIEQLKQHNLIFPNYANPCELYSVALDGTAEAFPSDAEDANLGLWGNMLSDSDGYFVDPIVLTLESEGQYSSRGLTLTFDTYNNIYATDISIKWLRITDEGIDVLDEKLFFPDSPIYFCKNKVSNYNKIIISFFGINMPENRLKLRSIEYGGGVVFTGEELKNININQSIDAISSEININTTDFLLNSKKNIEYDFQARQPITVYFNDRLISTTFVSTAKRLSKNEWKVQSNDYIGLMDRVFFQGGIYRDKNAVELLREIFDSAKIPFSFEEDLINEVVTGYIPYTTCRKALMQVLFAIQAVADTSNSDVVRIFVLDDEVQQKIPLKRIMQGQNFVEDDTVTSVEIAIHTYIETSENVNAYSATESGTGQNILIEFSEPLHSLTISNGKIVDSGANYAIINANEGCELTGMRYKHVTTTRSRKNPIVLANEIEKNVSIKDATLVSSNNIDKVIDKCYNWIVKSTTTNLKIVEGKHVVGGEYIRYGEAKYGTFKYGSKTPKIVTYDNPIKLGENIFFETEYLGSMIGRIFSQKFNINGGIIVKNCSVK